MIRLVALAAGTALALGACATGPSPATAATGGYTPALLVREPAPGSAGIRAAPPAESDQRLPLPTATDGADRGAPIDRVEAANRASLREPSRRGYVNAAQVYAWTDGAIYRLYTAPERVSAIALEPGESLVSVAAGDTVRWVIGDTTSGSGAARRIHILVKPAAVGLRTNLVIATDRRLYHVQLDSTARSAMASISWTYPADALLALRGTAEASIDVPSGSAAGALNHAYTISGDRPPWRPLRAFDNGEQVFIEFPASLARGEAPPLFVSGANGRTELVNYRVRGRFYIVDRLFAAAELRLGERRQQVVHIVRQGHRGSDRRR